MGQSQGKMAGASELRESAAAHHKKISRAAESDRATDHLLRLHEPEPEPEPEPYPHAGLDPGPRGLGAPLADVEHGVPIVELTLLGGKVCLLGNNSVRERERPPLSGGEVLLAQGKYHASVLGVPDTDGVIFGETKDCAARLGTSYSDVPVFSQWHGDDMNMAADKDNVYTLKNSIDEAVRAKAGEPIAVDEKAAAGEATHSGSGDNLDSAVVGILAASSAVTMVAAGAVSPTVAFGLFVVLLGGLTLAVSSVRGA